MFILKGCLNKKEDRLIKLFVLAIINWPNNNVAVLMQCLRKAGLHSLFSKEHAEHQLVLHIRLLRNY